MTNVQTDAAFPVRTSFTETLTTLVMRSVDPNADGSPMLQEGVARQDYTHSMSANRSDENLNVKQEPLAAATSIPDFDTLVSLYHKKIFNTIYRFIGDYEEATDLTQETFICAYRHYHNFRGDSKVFTWLYQIARNLCINKVRQRERQRNIRVESLDKSSLNDEDEGATRDIADLSQAPHTLLERKELQQRLVAAIESLPPEYKEVIILREYQDLSYNEIVEATGLTLENVKTRLSRARGMLRRKLEPYYRMQNPYSED